MILSACCFPQRRQLCQKLHKQTDLCQQASAFNITLGGKSGSRGLFFSQLAFFWIEWGNVWAVCVDPWLVLLRVSSAHRKHQIKASAAEGTESREVQREEASQTSQEGPQSCPLLWPKCKTRYTNLLLCEMPSPPADLFLISDSGKAKHVEQSGRILSRISAHSPPNVELLVCLEGFSPLALLI